MGEPEGRWKGNAEFRRKIDIWTRTTRTCHASFTTTSLATSLLADTHRFYHRVTFIVSVISIVF